MLIVLRLFAQPILNLDNLVCVVSVCDNSNHEQARSSSHSLRLQTLRIALIKAIMMKVIGCCDLSALGTLSFLFCRTFRHIL